MIPNHPISQLRVHPYQESSSTAPLPKRQNNPNARPSPLISKALLPPQCENQDIDHNQNGGFAPNKTLQQVVCIFSTKTGHWAAYIWSQKATNMSRLISNILWDQGSNWDICIYYKTKITKNAGPITKHKTFDQWKWTHKSIPFSSRLNKDVTDFDSWMMDGYGWTTWTKWLGKLSICMKHKPKPPICVN